MRSGANGCVCKDRRLARPCRWLLLGCSVFGMRMGLRLAFASPFARAAIAGLASAILAGCYVQARKMTR